MGLLTGKGGMLVREGFILGESHIIFMVAYDGIDSASHSAVGFDHNLNITNINH
jgi:hypothetical protein